jgi:hypothetical protein
MKTYVTLLLELDEDRQYQKLRDIDFEEITGAKVLVFSNVNLLKAMSDMAVCKNGNCEY